jgi:hypothetical protein
LIFAIVLMKSNRTIKENILLIILTLITFISLSRGTMLSYIIILLFYMFDSNIIKNIKIFIFLLIVLLVGLGSGVFEYAISRAAQTIDPNAEFFLEPSAASRLFGIIEIVKYYINEATIFNWLFGFGLGEGFIPSFDIGLPVSPDGYIRKIENTFFLIFLKQGLIGVILFMFLILSFFFKIRKYKKYYQNDNIYKGLYIYFIVVVISMMRIDTTGDNFFVMPLIMFLLSAYIYNTKRKKLEN